MVTDLHKIPGVGRKRGRGRSARRRQVFTPPSAEVASALGLARPPRPALHRPARPVRRRTLFTPSQVPWSSLLIGIGCVAVALYVGNLFWSATRVDVRAEGITDDMLVMPRALADRTVSFSLDPYSRIERTRFRIDGKPVPDDALDIKGDTITWKPGWLAEGVHHITLAVPRPPMPDSSFGWRVTIDNTPPELAVAPLQPAAELCKKVSVEGRVEKGSALTVDGQPVDHSGTFNLGFDQPPTNPLSLVAVDKAGNRSQAEVIVPIRYPGGQGIHVTAAAWAYEPLKRGVIELIDARLVSVVELDLKDEGGMIGYDSKNALALQSGAVAADYRMKDALSELKQKGVRVVGRLVAFKDPSLVKWAWDNNKRDMVVQTTDGAPLPGGFTNLFHPEVRRYNLDIAVEAVNAGVDDVLWDYMRRPEGDPETMVIPGLKGSSSDGVVDFLKESKAALHERCAFQGVSVFGIAADRPHAVGQDVPRLARAVDYIAPMLYPSHWNKGEYGVDYPNGQPGDIVKASLAHFQQKVAGTGVYLMPWLQDFTWGYPYGPAEVRAQINASGDLGVRDWLLWSPEVTYTAGALQPSLVSVRS